MPSTPNAAHYLFQGNVSLENRESTPNAAHFLFQGNVATVSVSVPIGHQYLFQGDVSDNPPAPPVGIGTVKYPITENWNERPQLRY